MSKAKASNIGVWLNRLRSGKALYFLSDLCKLSELSVASMRRATQRLVKRGLLKRVGKELYWNTFKACSLELLANTLVIPSYVSMESALNQHGILLQAPQVLTCLTTQRPRTVKTPLGTIVYQHLAPRYFWGYTQVSQHGAVASPEKAVVDYIYQRRQNGQSISMDEWEIGAVNKALVKKYAQKFPRTVQNLWDRHVGSPNR